eukprot:Rhum_TRINITY_DN565_c0_g1::Rhum_TRINITY_DN565_c0_g1_i1::g.1829::m.1829/K03847/ALG12; alpha-1,6-mannosyltransferase
MARRKKVDGKDREPSFVPLSPANATNATQPSFQAPAGTRPPSPATAAGSDAALAPRRGVDIFELLPFVVIAAYVAACPFTKVEESFNMQATHDIIFKRNITGFDHHVYPGVVPRTFIGPLALSALSSPFVTALGLFLGSPCVRTYAMYVARLVLGWTQAVLLVKASRESEKICGSFSRKLFLLISSVQFHPMYYASRTLPNSFAMVGFLWAFETMLKSESAAAAGGTAVPLRMTAFKILAATCVIFRGELAILVGPLVLSHMVTSRVPFWHTCFVGIATGLSSIALSVVVDSMFWERLVYPEGEGMYFNIVLNKSHEWGVSPFDWYFRTALPKALMFFYLLVPLSMVYVKRLRLYTVPALMFVFIYSFLPHKELRFIFYVVPVLNLSVAAYLGQVHAAASTPARRGLLLTAIAGVCLACVAACCVLTFASSLNYPAGEALEYLHEARKSGGKVHIGVGPSMEGVTRFQKNACSGWTYDKNPLPLASETYDFLITDTPQNFTHKGYRVLHSVASFDGVDTGRLFALDLWPPPVLMRNATFVMEVSSASSSHFQRIVSGQDLSP